MIIGKNQPVAFTTTYKTKTRTLTTPITVCSDFDQRVSKDLVGVWDTGASTSSIHRKYAEEMNLPVLGMCIVNTASGQARATQHRIKMKLPNQEVITLIVTATDLVNYDMLIGMDVISQGDFAVSNFEGKTKLNFRMPSIAHTDFVQQIQNSIPAKAGIKTGRNDPCPCGSGKKYKNCCGKDKR